MNTAWGLSFVYTLNTSKQTSPGSGAAGAIFSVSILPYSGLVGSDVSLGADPAAGAGVGSGMALAAPGLRRGRTGQGDLAAGLFVCLGVRVEDWSVMLGNKFGLLLEYQLPGNCHRSN